MSRRRWSAVALLLLGAACAPYVVKTNVMGPHGEPLTEISCNTNEECMSFAREACGGDFDVAAPLAKQDMLVHCQKTSRPDAGP
jgi:hypothetical protein